MRVFYSLLAVGAALGSPAHAEQLFSPSRRDGVERAIVPSETMTGRYQAGKYIATPDVIQIRGSGSTGDASGLTVSPNSTAASGSLAKILADPTFPGPVNVQDALTAPGGGVGAFWTKVDPAAMASYGIPLPARIGAKVHRLSDRLLVGAATVNSGDFPATKKDWYEQLESKGSHPGGFRTSWAQTASISTNGGIGVLGAARTSDSQVPTFQLAMGGLFAAHNNNTKSQQLATALYAVAFREPEAGVGPGAGTVGGEVDIANKGNSLKLTPSSVDDTRGHTTALKLNSGAAMPNATAASAGLTLGNNRGKFLTGLIVAQNAIEGVVLDKAGKATAGEGEAIGLGAFQSFAWWVTGGSAPSAKIISRQVSATNAQEISFEDLGTFYGGPAGKGRAFATVYPGGATGAFISATPAFGTNAPTLGIMGAANSDLRLQSSGTGVVTMGNEAGAFLTAKPTGIAIGGTVQLQLTTVALLPPCNAKSNGSMAAVSDAAGTPTYNGAVVGGGMNSLPVYCNGAAWTMH